MRRSWRWRREILLVLLFASWAVVGTPALAQDSGSVKVGDTQLRWVREGSGLPIFVLGSAVYYPKAFSRHLRNHFQLVFIDGRHFVPAYTPGRERLAAINLATFADDVEAVRQALGYERIVVAGHSIHGQIALEYADRYAERTSEVVLIAAVPFAFAEFAADADRVWQELASDERKSVMAARLAIRDDVLAGTPQTRRFAADYNLRGPLYWADPQYDATTLLEGLENGPAFARLAATLPSPEQARARLERISAPILLVLGKLDFAIPYTVWEELIRGVPNVEYYLLAQDSHNPQTESADRFDPILIRWLSRKRSEHPHASTLGRNLVPPSRAPRSNKGDEADRGRKQMNNFSIQFAPGGLSPGS